MLNYKCVNYVSLSYLSNVQKNIVHVEMSLSNSEATGSRSWTTDVNASVNEISFILEQTIFTKKC